MREVTTHHAPGLNEAVRVYAVDKPGPGGAHFTYVICIGPTATAEGELRQPGCRIRFQQGAVHEVGWNGVTHEALIAILIDRLKKFQEGPCPCSENGIALDYLEDALHWLHKRTIDRLERGVTGRKVK